MSTHRKGTAVVEQRLEDFMNAAQALLAPGVVVMIDGQPIDGPALVAKVQAMVDLYKEADDLRARFKQAVALRNAAEPGALVYLGDALSAMIQQFGHGTPELDQFGVKERKKPAPLTGEQIVVRAARARATRVARGTLGPRQRLAIKASAAPLQVSVVPAEPPAVAAPPPLPAKAPSPPLEAESAPPSPVPRPGPERPPA